MHNMQYLTILETPEIKQIKAIFILIVIDNIIFFFLNEILKSHFHLQDNQNGNK